MERQRTSALATLLGLGVVAWLGAGACREAPRPSDSAGSPSVESVVLDRIATFGCAACSGVELLDRVRHLSVTGGGLVYVTNGSEPFVRRFVAVRTAENAALPRAWSTGRVGEGPGEMSFPFYTYPLEDGRFFVVDSIPPRITEFDARGEVLRTVSIPPVVPTNAAYDRASGSLFIVWMSPFTRERVQLLRWDGLGDPATQISIAHDLLPEETPGRDSRRFSFAAWEGELAIGLSWDYRIRFFDREGNFLHETGREIPRQRKSEDQIATELEEMERFAGTASLEPDVVPEYAHHFGRFAFDYDGDGRLWVLTTRGDETSTVFDLFDAAGDYLGEVSVDARIEERPWRGGNVFDVDGDYLAAVYLDEADNEFVGVWRLVAR